MTKRKIYLPNALIQELADIVKTQAYTALMPVFSEVSCSGEEASSTEYLSLDLSDAKLLIRLADIEMSKAILKYPYNEDDDPQYDPLHEEQFDEIMMGVYEKTYYYLQSEFPALKEGA